MVIVQVPAIFSCKLTGGVWINLASARVIQFIDLNTTHPIALVNWTKHETSHFYDEDALAIHEAWMEAHNRFNKREINESSDDFSLEEQKSRQLPKRTTGDAGRPRRRRRRGTSYSQIEADG